MYHRWSLPFCCSLSPLSPAKRRLVRLHLHDGTPHHGGGQVVALREDADLEEVLMDRREAVGVGGEHLEGAGEGADHLHRLPQPHRHLGAPLGHRRELRGGEFDLVLVALGEEGYAVVQEGVGVGVGPVQRVGRRPRGPACVGRGARCEAEEGVGRGGKG